MSERITMSDDGLKAVYTYVDQEGALRDLTLTFETADKVPSQEELLKFFRNVSDSKTPSETTHKVALPFGVDATFGTLENEKSNEAAIALGRYHINIPFNKNGELKPLRTYIEKTDAEEGLVFGIGKSKGVFAAFRKKNDKL